jgi:ABC-type nickel/cobalt efflux system permease component RcnA
VYGVGQIFGGISVQLSIFYGVVLVVIAVGVLAFVGRRRQKRAKAQRSEQIAAGPKR